MNLLTMRRCGGVVGMGLAMALLAACQHGMTRSAASQGAAEGGVSVVFPDPDRALMKEGVYADAAALRRFAPGMSKDQLYALLGTPHFNEGMWGVRRWNYLFNFRTGQGGEYFTCQFQVRFDDGGVAQGGYWKPQNCAALVEPPRPSVAVAPAPSALPAQPLRLAADALFAFDSAALSPEGHAAVQGVLAQVREASRVQDIQVVGHSDRIGAGNYNEQLSRRRAEAVRNALVAGGVPAAAISAEGRGAAEPLVRCDEPTRGALVECLAPNRRVQIAGLALRD